MARLPVIPNGPDTRLEELKLLAEPGAGRRGSARGVQGCHKRLDCAAAGARCAFGGGWRTHGRGYETIQILEVPIGIGDRAAVTIVKLHAQPASQRPRGEAVAPRFLLTGVAAGFADQPVIQLVQEDKERQLIGILQLQNVERPPPRSSRGAGPRDVRLKGVGISIAATNVDVDSTGSIEADA